MVPRQSLPGQIKIKIPMFSMRRHIGQDGVLNETRTAERWVQSSYAHAQLSKFTSSRRPSSSGREIFMALNLRSYPPSLYLDAGKEGMIHLLVGSYVQKPDSGFFSDWSRNNTCGLWFAVSPD